MGVGELVKGAREGERERAREGEREQERERESKRGREQEREEVRKRERDFSAVGWALPTSIRSSHLGRHLTSF